jgi:hypothetical protein
MNRTRINPLLVLSWRPPNHRRDTENNGLLSLSAKKSDVCDRKDASAVAGGAAGSEIASLCTDRQEAVANERGDDSDNRDPRRRGGNRDCGRGKTSDGGGGSAGGRESSGAESGEMPETGGDSPAKEWEMLERKAGQLLSAIA